MRATNVNGPRNGRAGKTDARITKAPDNDQHAAARRRSSSSPAVRRKRGAPASAEPVKVDYADFVRLSENARLLGAVIESIPIVLWSLDPQGTFTYHNGMGLDGAGLKRGQHVGENIFEIYGEDATREVREVLTTGNPLHWISEGHGVYWENWLIPVRSAHGEVISVIGFTMDITAAKRAEQELRAKVDVIERQQQVIRDLSTPIIEVWDRVLTLPMIGVLDTMRTSEVMESLLRRIVETGARFAILDLTGVEVVDTKVASHLINLVNAIRLLGAEGIISGVKPTVAQTMVGLGLDLSSVMTHANLRAALKFCMRRAAQENRAD